jgi:WD40 repeat protein
MISCLSGRQGGLTNQRLWTDLSSDGKWFVSGGTDGIVKGWKTDVLMQKVDPSWEVKLHDGMSPEDVGCDCRLCLFSDVAS